MSLIDVEPNCKAPNLTTQAKGNPAMHHKDRASALPIAAPCVVERLPLIRLAASRELDLARLE